MSLEPDFRVLVNLQKFDVPIELLENVLLIDSMPIEVCRYSRAKGCRILKGNEQQAPTFGFCASLQ